MILPSAGTVHGSFSPDRPPLLTVPSGASVELATLDVSWGFEPPVDHVAARAKLERPPGEDGPAMTGPIAVENALPGDTLEVIIEAIDVGDYGFTWAGETGLLLWRLESGTGTNQFGHALELDPFPGTLGLSPGAPGLHDGWTPRRTGGNMDCRELVVGSALYLPVEAPGALLSVGDGHAAQGDGEVGGTAVECRFARIRLRLTLVDLAVEGPVVRGREGWSFLAFGEDCARRAVEAFLDFIPPRLSRDEALGLVSTVGHLRHTQIVNPLPGAHLFVPHRYCRSLFGFGEAPEHG